MVSRRGALGWSVAASACAAHAEGAVFATETAMPLVKHQVFGPGVR